MKGLVLLLVAACGARAQARCQTDEQLAAALPAPGFVMGASGGGPVALASTQNEVLAFDGCHLERLPLPLGPDSQLRRAFAFDNRQIWGLASSRSPALIVVRWDGSRWDRFPFGSNPVSAPAALWASGPADVWIAGGMTQAGELYRWDGQRLARVALPASEAGSPFTAVGGTGPADVWVAIDSQRALRWDGRSWRRDDGKGRLPSTSRPWTVGPAGIELWSEQRWRRYPAAVVDLPGGRQGTTDEIAIAGTRLFATAHEGKILAPDGQGDWQEAFSFRTGDRYAPRPSTSGWGRVDGLRLPSERLGLAFGTWRQFAVLLRWDGAGWTALGPLPWETVTALLATGSEIWAATAATWRNGKRAGGRVLRWDGQAWRPLAQSASPLLELAVGPDGALWAAGEAGTVLRCRGGSCAPVATGTDENLMGLWSAGGKLWIGGAGGSLFEWDGRVFQRRAPPRGWTLHALWGPAPDRIWATSTSVLRWSGQGWTTPGDLAGQMGGAYFTGTSVLGTGPDDVWVAGTAEYPSDQNYVSRETRLLHWNGQAWSSQSVSHGSGTRRAIALHRLALTGGGMWLAGDEGLLRRRQGEGWVPVATGTSEPIWAVAVAGDDVWIAAGDSPLPVRIPSRR